MWNIAPLKARIIYFLSINPKSQLKNLSPLQSYCKKENQIENCESKFEPKLQCCGERNMSFHDKKCLKIQEGMVYNWQPFRRVALQAITS